MTASAFQHQSEIRQHLRDWAGKPLLRQVYAGFYRKISAWIDPATPGRIVELGSGIGNLKQHFPQGLATDLFPNPWLDLACDAYELPFRDGTVSHLVLLDVFHHLQAPGAFLKEAARVLVSGGRLILLEPCISPASWFAYTFCHHEPVGWRRPICRSTSPPPRPRPYYAAQGNATRLFLRRALPGWPAGWIVLHGEAFACFAYLLSGGYRKPALYPARWLGLISRVDAALSRWPGLFAGRCLVVLTPQLESRIPPGR
jgi:SAM-dependent methyltransferase